MQANFSALSFDTNLCTKRCFLRVIFWSKAVVFNACQLGFVRNLLLADGVMHRLKTGFLSVTYYRPAWPCKTVQHYGAN